MYLSASARCTSSPKRLRGQRAVRDRRQRRSPARASSSAAASSSVRSRWSRCPGSSSACSDEACWNAPRAGAGALDQHRHQLRQSAGSPPSADVSEKRDRMVVEDPVVLTADEARRPRATGRARERLGAADAEPLEVAEQRLVVTELLVDMLLEIRRERRPRDRRRRGWRARASAASVSGTVARMIWCWRTRYSGQSSRRRGWSTKRRIRRRERRIRAVELPPEAGARRLSARQWSAEPSWGCRRLSAISRRRARRPSPASPFPSVELLDHLVRALGRSIPRSARGAALTIVIRLRPWRGPFRVVVTCGALLGRRCGYPGCPRRLCEPLESRA